MADARDTQARRSAISRLLRTQVVQTQEALGALLAEAGFTVTQATLSRDLARLGARRVSRPGGGAVYELGGAMPARTDDVLWAVHALVTHVDDGDALVVVHTLPGGAPAVAAAIDAARPGWVLGTIAGDDTIFVAPARGVRPAKAKRALLSAWKKGEA